MLSLHSKWQGGTWPAQPDGFIRVVNCTHCFAFPECTISLPPLSSSISTTTSHIQIIVLCPDIWLNVCVCWRKMGPSDKTSQTSGRFGCETIPSVMWPAWLSARLVKFGQFSLLDMPDALPGISFESITFHSDENRWQQLLNNNPLAHTLVLQLASAQSS
jgi:hypothetical protein